MRFKNKVDARFLRGEIIRYLFNIEAIFRYHREEERYNLVITSARDGEHQTNSKHYEHQAVDFRIWGFKAWQLQEIKQDMDLLLGSDYQVVIEKTHIHLEYDPPVASVVATTLF